MKNNLNFAIFLITKIVQFAELKDP